MLPDKIPPALSVDARQVDRALTLDISDHLRHRVFWRYRDPHVHMVAHQMAFFNPALLLHSQSPKYLPEMFSQTHVQRFATTLRDEHHVVFALPLRMA